MRGSSEILEHRKGKRGACVRERISERRGCWREGMPVAVATEVGQCRRRQCRGSWQGGQCPHDRDVRSGGRRGQCWRQRLHGPTAHEVVDGTGNPRPDLLPHSRPVARQGNAECGRTELPSGKAGNGPDVRFPHPGQQPRVLGGADRTGDILDRQRHPSGLASRYPACHQVADRMMVPDQHLYGLHVGA